jgi:hypothetical protein
MNPQLADQAPATLLRVGVVNEAGHHLIVAARSIVAAGSADQGIIALRRHGMEASVWVVLTRPAGQVSQWAVGDLQR